MDTPSLLKFFFAFAFVLSLMFMLSWGLKRLGLAGTSLLPNGKRRLRIVETLPLDIRRKLVIVRRDNKEHLLVLGPTGETVIEANIPVDENIIDLPAMKEPKNAEA